MHGWEWMDVASSFIAGFINWVLVSVSSLLFRFRFSGATLGLQQYVARVMVIVYEAGRNVAAMCCLLHGQLVQANIAVTCFNFEVMTVFTSCSKSTALIEEICYL